MKPKLIIVLGPTASGKSEIALRLAEEREGEIINADSLQVYRYLDIGTGKPSAEERARVPHHLIDIVDPDEEFHVAMFRHLALDAVSKIVARGKPVIVCGGTGLYIKALTRGLFQGPQRSKEFRQRIDEEIEQKGLGVAYQRLERLDPAMIGHIHPNDRQRIIRALEVYEITGKPMSEWQRGHAFKDDPFDTLKIGANREREELYQRINARCQRMIQEGLLAEVQSLVSRGYGLGLKPMQSVGYRHMGLVSQNKLMLEEALALMQSDTRHLAKRQLTWFRQDRGIKWFHPEREWREIEQAVERFLSSTVAKIEP
jgi:tRNA dimethylallyltransferase